MNLTRRLGTSRPTHLIPKTFCSELAKLPRPHAGVVKSGIKARLEQETLWFFARVARGLLVRRAWYLRYTGTKTDAPILGSSARSHLRFRLTVLNPTDGHAHMKCDYGGRRHVLGAMAGDCPAEIPINVVGLMGPGRKK